MSEKKDFVNLDLSSEDEIKMFLDQWDKNNPNIRLLDINEIIKRLKQRIPIAQTKAETDQDIDRLIKMQENLDGFLRHEKYRIEYLIADSQTEIVTKDPQYELDEGLRTIGIEGTTYKFSPIGWMIVSALYEAYTGKSGLDILEIKSRLAESMSDQSKIDKMYEKPFSHLLNSNESEREFRQRYICNDDLYYKLKTLPT